MLSTEIQEELVSPDAAKALGTYGPEGLNVVPVSTIKIVGGKIWLFDYFFEKTKTNILENSDVSLVYWIGLRGNQIKAKGTYLTSGDDFDSAVAYIAELHPTRVLKGLFVLEAKEVFDISVDTKV